MDKTTKRKRWPWGIVIGMLLPAGVAVVVHNFADIDKHPPVAGVIYAALLAVLAFLAGRLLLNTFWGLALGVLFAVHPLMLNASLQDSVFLLGEVQKLAVLCCVLVIWKKTWQAQPAYFSIVGLGLAAALLGGWAWLTSPHAGWVTLLFSALGLALLPFLAILQRKVGTTRPTWVHIALAGFLCIAVPLLSLAAAFGASQAAAEMSAERIAALKPIVAHSLPADIDMPGLLEKSIQPEKNTGLLPDVFRDDRQKWTWPFPWAVVALLVVGLYRTIRRGWKHWPTGKAPLSWALLLFILATVLAAILHPQSVRHAHFVPLATATLLLATFGAADFLRSIGEQLVLKPPGEE